MPWWLWLLDLVGLLLLLVVLGGVLLVLRRRWLERRGGTFELSVRRLDRSGPTGPWVLGVGRYRDDSLEWFRIFSLSLSPTRTWRRSHLRIIDSREPEEQERHALYAGHVVVRCASGPEGTGAAGATLGPDDLPGADLELALAPSALTGLSSWLEAGPPGSGGAGAGG